MNQQINKKKIVWVTPDSFVDCDFNPSLFKLLLKDYDIKWIIILPKSGSLFNEKSFEEIGKLNGLTIEFLYSTFRQRDPRRFLFYNMLYKKINEAHYDLLYSSLGPADPYAVPFFWRLNKKKTIFAVHEGHVNDNFKLPLLSNLLLKSTYFFIKFAHLFSTFAANIFHEHYPKSKIFTIPLILKSFGKSNAQRSEQPVIFLAFGNINHAKNIDLLIEAACNMYERGIRGFKISINGSCSNWDFYTSKIRYPEIFNCDIRKIKNDEIANLFSQSHYVVLPYRSTSQSGVVKVAFNYNVPVIASDLPGFREEIYEDINGYFFKQGDVKSLEETLIKTLQQHNTTYSSLLEKMKQHTTAFYSTDVINAKYASMFNEVVKKN